MKCFFLLIAFLLTGWFGFFTEALAAEERLVAVILAESQPRYQQIHSTFVENAKAFCGENCKIYVQTPNSDAMSLRNSVRKVVALDADLIITYGFPAALAAKNESPPMPTLFVDVYDPVQMGLVPERNQNSRKMTGIRGDAPVQALFKYFVEAAKPHNLAVLYDSKEPAENLQKAVLEKACKMRHVEMLPIEREKSKDHYSVLESIPVEADGLYIANGEYSDAQLNSILEFASSRKLPVITQRSGMGSAGAFMVLETSDVEQGEKLAEMSSQIFIGKKVSEIPIYKPRQIDFIVNLKVAKDYGIQVPFQILSVATQVVR